MKIVVLEPLGVATDRIEKSAMDALGEAAEVVFYPTRTDSVTELIERGHDADVLVLANMPLKKEVLKGCPNVKLISVAFTGVDHIPMDYCHEKGIIVSNCAGYSTRAVSELVFGLLISVCRNIVRCDVAARSGKTKDGLIGTEIYGKTFGVVGTGAIGLRAAEIALAFGCRVIAYSRTKKDIPGIEYMELDELLKESDIVSLHTPLNEHTRHLISAEKIALMKPSAILINTARGGVVDNDALASALKGGRLAGAGIDVFDQEPPLPTDKTPLLDCETAVVTPHVAFASKEALITRGDMVFQNIAAWNDGNPINVM